MLYVFHGSNIEQSREKSRKLAGSLLSKRPDAALEEVNLENWSPALIESHLGGQGLFLNKYIIFLDRLGEDKPAEEQIIHFAGAMDESPNIFIVLEGKLSAGLSKVFEKYAEKMVHSDSVTVSGPRTVGGKISEKPDFNIFSLADAVGSRNSLKAWSLYRQAVDGGIEAENIIGTLFWQIKSIILARDAKSGRESTLSPFVFAKAKKYATNYSEAELRNMLGRLVAIYHDGHRGFCSPELSVEKLILDIETAAV